MKYRIPEKYSGFHSFLTCQSSVITGINKGFLRQTGYSESEIINRHIDDVLTGLLRIQHHKVQKVKAKGMAECFLFTKALQPRKVCIRLVNEGDSDRSVYYFIDKSGSCLNDYLLTLKQLNDTACALYAVPELILLKASPKYLGYLPEPANKAEYSIGKSVGNIFPDFKGSAQELVWNRAIGSGKIKHVKKRRKFSENQVTYWESCVIPVFKNRKVRYIYEVITDVTDRDKNNQPMTGQAQLTKVKQLKLDILESIRVGFVILDQDWRFAYVNPQAAHYLGLKPDKLVGRLIWDCLEWLDKTEVGGYLRQAQMECRPISFEFHYPDTDQYFNCSIYPATSGMAIYWVETTKHKHAEREAIRNKKKADILYEMAGKLHASNMPLRIIKKLCLKITDFLGCQLFINYIVDEKRKKLRMNACWGLDDQMRKELEWIDYGHTLCGCAARDRTRVVVENIQHSTDTETEWYRTAGIRAFASHPLVEKDRVVGTLAFGSRTKDTFSRDDLALMKAVADLTATAINRVRTERRMKEQHQLMLEAERERIAALKRYIKMKDEFLSIISHEFKTPLAVIFSAIQTMEHTCGDELSEKAKSFISKIRQNSLRQLRLVNNLLDITRLNSGWLIPNWSNVDIVRLTRAITQSVEVYARQKNIALTFQSRLKQRVIQMDQEKYERILLNLLSNAIKFTPEGKSVTVRVYMTKKFGSRMVGIEVKDEGMGIPREKMDAIFERFFQVDSSFTRQAEGIGIGLCLAQKFTESLGGRMTAKSKVGQGSSFSVFFPDTKKECSDAGPENVQQDYKLLLTASVEFSDMVS